jgi:hypothetical protein
MSNNKIPFKITQGLKNKLNTVPLVNGQIIYCTDTAEIYIDTLNSQSNVVERIDITKAGSFAKKETGIFYIEGTGSTDTTAKVATWLGAHDDIDKYYPGLTILYKVSTAGSTSTTLNINGLGPINVVRNATTGVSTAFPVNSIVLLTYTMDSDGNTYWKTADYDTNSYSYVRQYYTTTDKEYPLLFKYDPGLTTTTNYVTKYTRTANNMHANPFTGTITANEFVGNLTGTAESATSIQPINHENYGNITMWRGTKAQYDAISTKNPNCLYIITDDIPKQQTWQLTLLDGTVVERDVVLYE